MHERTELLDHDHGNYRPNRHLEFESYKAAGKTDEDGKDKLYAHLAANDANEAER